MRKPVTIVQGGLYGSEAKGAIAAYLVNKDKIDIAVRTGATNAGHTAYFGGRPVVLQQLPVGFVRPDTTLVLGAGALIDPEILDREVSLLSEVTGTDIRNRLRIDRRAGLHVRAHAERSKASGRHHAIGATGKGCSEALIDRIRNRGTDQEMQFGNSPYAAGYDVCDTEAYLNWSIDEGASVMLEGTQGQLLDLYLGPYPYTTHKQTGPAQWMLEAGLSPSLPTYIVSVIRTFPIRVAGNSGPLPSEISWPTLARAINLRRRNHGLPALVPEGAIQEFEGAVKMVSAGFMLPESSNGLDQHDWNSEDRRRYAEALSEINKAALMQLPQETVAELKRLFEMTTVTKKLRRIAALDWGTLKESARQIRPHALAVTFMNYLYPEHWFQKPDQLTDEMTAMLEGLSISAGTKVRLASFGPSDDDVMEL